MFEKLSQESFKRVKVLTLSIIYDNVAFNRTNCSPLF